MLLSPRNKEKIIPNILHSSLSLGEKVCIVAPGPNGAKHYHEIPDDYSIIVVNKAIQIEAITPTWWVIAHTDTSWFEKVDRRYTGVRIYCDRALPTVTQTAMDLSKDKVYYFNLEKEPLQEDTVLPVEGCIRFGASVSALATQLAFNMGAREILFCGVDMSGNGYWDRTENEDPGVRYLHGDTWDSVKRLNPLLHYLRSQFKVKISTLSESKLDVPFYKKE